MKLQKDPDLKQQYHAVLQEYLDLGHLSETKPQPSKQGCNKKFHLPNQTKSPLHTGPKLQDDLLHILLRYRVRDPSVRPYWRHREDPQAILIRDEDRTISKHPIARHQRTAQKIPAQYRHIRTFRSSLLGDLKQLAQDEGHRFPTAAEILQRDFYVDDALTDAPTQEETFALPEELTQIFKTAGLNKRGYPMIYMCCTLGIVWNVAQDVIQYSVKSPQSASQNNTWSGICSQLYSNNAMNFTRTQIDPVTFYTKNIPLWKYLGGSGEIIQTPHLTRVVSAVTFVYEDFYTLVIEIEEILNSRPLTPISSNPNDLFVITPDHLLISDSLTNLPDLNYRKISSNRLSTWRHVQKIKQEDNTLSMQWPLGRIVQVYLGSDGVIRTVKMAKSILDRRVKRLAPLPYMSDDAEPSSTENQLTASPHH
ncbi:unnamed protein product [Heterotrigona itama]|uniref:DUF5641 domain-containing protein n=1 Tax=Heterotrigona itama TaxID=395501 RepID=A0A6V7HC07_9HYME|nr:unnamed protein product [Heterotrigona itama]